MKEKWDLFNKRTQLLKRHCINNNNEINLKNMFNNIIEEYFCIDFLYESIK